MLHSLLSKRLKGIYNVFGQLPDVLEDAWINIAIGEQDKALEIKMLVDANVLTDEKKVLVLQQHPLKRE